MNIVDKFKHMKNLIIVIYFTMLIIGCGKEENSEIVRSVLFNCYNPEKDGDLKPNEYNGLPWKCYGIYFNEDFTSNSGKWKIENMAEYSYQISSGYYKLKSKNTTNWYTGINLKDIAKTGRFQIDVKMKLDQSASMNSAMSLYFGEYGSLEYAMEFGLYEDGRYHIRELKSKKYQPYIIGPLKTSYNNDGEFNSITVRLHDNVLYFFLNENYLSTVQFGSFIGTSIGFSVPAMSEVLVDEIKVRRLFL
jgi:hypothetical protein